MSRESEVTWCDSSVNPVMGCDGCELWKTNKHTCYAGVMHQMYGGARGWAPQFHIPTKFGGRVEESTTWSDLTGELRPKKPWLDGLPRIIFLSDMGDALSTVIDFDWLYQDSIVPIMSPDGSKHIYIWSTKRAARMLKFSEWLAAKGIPWPRNLWPMTSITSAKVSARADSLRKIPAEIKVLSCEPILSRFSMRGIAKDFQWVILGGESAGKKGAQVQVEPFDIETMAEGISDCQAMGIPVFAKQIGSHALLDGKRFPTKNTKGEDPSEWPFEVCGVKLNVREMPIKAAIQQEML